MEVVGRPLAHACLEGLNCCIFAYGQTGAGKTYTMVGEVCSEQAGLQPRMVDHLWALMAEASEAEWTVRCSYLEMYNEQVLDLLCPQRSGTTLTVREDVKRGVFVEGLSEEAVTSAE